MFFLKGPTLQHCQIELVMCSNRAEKLSNKSSILPDKHDIGKERKRQLSILNRKETKHAKIPPYINIHVPYPFLDTSSSQYHLNHFLDSLDLHDRRDK